MMRGILLAALALWPIIAAVLALLIGAMWHETWAEHEDESR